MKTTSWLGIALGLTLLAPCLVRAQAPKDPDAVMVELISNSHWTWYEGAFDRYPKAKNQLKDSWVEFYKDGSARVPWRGHPQMWKFEPPNKLTIMDGPNGDKHAFILDVEKKAGSSENQNLHIRYEKRASRPSKFK